MKSPEKIFSNFKISKKRTIEIIPKASLIIFSLSSAMTTAVLLRKKILCIQSNLMGDYLLRLSNKYINDLDLKKVNIDNFNSENKNKTYLKIFIIQLCMTALLKIGLIVTEKSNLVIE